MSGPAVAVLLLAAGRSSRMGANKLTMPLKGKALLAHAADSALAAGMAEVVVVTGHQAETIRQILAGRPVTWVHNADYEQGIASSLRAGVGALPATIDAILVCLGDMPLVSARQLRDIAGAYDPATGHNICVPIFDGKRGNPVLFGRGHFAEILTLEGDRGARSLLDRHADQVRQVVMTDDAVLTDVDTPEAFLTIARSPS